MQVHFLTKNFGKYDTSSIGSYMNVGGFEALRKRDRVTKDTSTDIDSLTEEQREAQIEELELRDISDHKLRKVLRDLDRQVGQLGRHRRISAE